jgi:hypothetical protein
MNRFLFQSALFLILCPLLTAQQPTQAASTPAVPPPPQAVQISGTLHLAQDAPKPDEPPPLTAVDLDRNQILKNARTIFISSQTDFLSSATLSRALLNQKDWEKLGLNIITDMRRYDLEIEVNRVVFTHIHTYTISDRKTGLVLASGRIRAFDGVVASGPMAEQIVKFLSTARL